MFGLTPIRQAVRNVFTGQWRFRDVPDRTAVLNAAKLAADLGVPALRISQIVRGQRGISADTALRLARYFGTTPELWVNLQAHYDLRLEQDRLASRLEKEVKVLAAA
ncbi:MAG: HigA family addiction module antidote protein [Verrucomicrobia bacterium]|nr:HigA family addiction module antidote protein [Verrucomicrobiota bacterium]